MVRRRSLVALAIAALVSCTGSNDAEAGGKDDAAQKQGGYERVEVEARTPPVLEVQSTGDEPRLRMRLHPEEGLVDPMVMSMGIEMSMVNGAQRMPKIPVPTTVTEMKAEVTGVKSGEITVRHSVDAVRVDAQPDTPPEVVEKVKESIEPLVQYRGETRMDDRGTVLGGYAEIPRDLPPMVHNTMQQMTQSLGQMSVPLPEPEMGVGAQWTATEVIEQNGMKLRQVAHYTMLAIEGDHATIEVVLQQSLEDPEVKVPGMLIGEARVGRFESKGAGTFELDLDHVIPRSVSLRIDLSMAMDVSAMGQAQHVEMDMGMTMTMSRGSGA